MLVDDNNDGNKSDRRARVARAGSNSCSGQPAEVSRARAANYNLWFSLLLRTPDRKERTYKEFSPTDWPVFPAKLVLFVLKTTEVYKLIKNYFSQNQLECWVSEFKSPARINNFLWPFKFSCYVNTIITFLDNRRRWDLCLTQNNWHNLISTSCIRFSHICWITTKNIEKTKRISSTKSHMCLLLFIAPPSLGFTLKYM